MKSLPANMPSERTCSKCENMKPLSEFSSCSSCHWGKSFTCLECYHMKAIWQGMRQRCLNPRNHKYPIYGGRGITICDRWEKFRNFLQDMSPRPSLRYSLDRIDNSKGYSPENCRWATARQQGLNTRQNVRLTFNGETLTIIEWSRKLNLATSVINYRLKRNWPVEKVLMPEKNSEQTRFQAGKYLTFEGRTLPLSAWAKEFGLKDSTLHQRLKYGWDAEKALRTPTKRSS